MAGQKSWQLKKSHCSYGLKLKDLGLLTEASNGVQQEIWAIAEWAGLSPQSELGPGQEVRGDLGSGFWKHCETPEPPGQGLGSAF